MLRKQKIITINLSEDKIVQHVNKMFGWHGGMGDPPDEDVVRAIIRGTQEFLKLDEQKDLHT